jgi:WD40 repeat protein/lipoprotein NlpI
LTLHPAFDGQDRQEVLRQIAFEEPRLLRLIHRAIPAELETIVLKAMAKVPAERYATAQELADDLQRFLDDKPIRARRATLVQKTRKWTRRHPGVVATATAALIVVVLALAVSNVLITWEKNQKADALRDKETALDLAQTNFEEAHRQKKAAQASFEEADRQKKAAQKQEGIAEAEAQRAREQERLARRRFYAAQMNLAHQAWEAGHPARVLELLQGQRPKLGQEDLRCFEWYYLWRLCQTRCRLTLRGHRATIFSVALSSDGRTLASIGEDSTMKLWDLPTGKVRVTVEEETTLCTAVAFSPDGKTLATGNISLWDVATGQKQAALAGHPSGLRGLAFSPDGKTLAAGSDAGEVTLWDVARRQKRATLRRHKGSVWSLAFSPDGKTLATASDWGEGADGKAGVVWVWDLTAEPVRPRLRLPAAFCVAISPDGRTLAADAGWMPWLSGEMGSCYEGRAASARANDLRTVRLYDLQTGKERGGFPGHFGIVHSLAFLPDGKTLVSAAEDRSVRLWDVASGQVREQLAHRGAVFSVALSADGRTLASGGEDRAVRLWNLERCPNQTTLQHPGGGNLVAFSPSGKTLISGGSQLKLWDVATGHEVQALRIPQTHLAVSPDGKLLAAWDATEVKLWELPTGQLRGTIPGQPGFHAGVLTFSPDGKTLALDSEDGSLRLWDVAAQRIRLILPSLGKLLYGSVAFSPNSKLLAAGGQGGWFKLWDAATGQLRATLTRGEGAWGFAGPVAFSPDGKTLASGNKLGTVRLWDVESGRLRASLKGHTLLLSALAFFPDSKTLATAGTDTTIKLWDVATGQERVTLQGHKAAVLSLAIAPNGNVLASGSMDGTVQLWRAATDAEATARKTDLDADDPDSPLAHNNLGDRLSAVGRLPEAVAAYCQARNRLKKLAAALPNVPAYRQELTRSHLRLAQIYGQQKKLDNAMAELSQLIALRSDEAEVYHQRGLLYESVQQWDQAALDLSKGIELQPARWEPRLWRAEFYARRGRWAKAADDFASASELIPDNMDLRYWHALARVGDGDLSAYRGACGAVLDRFGQNDLPDKACWVLVLAPDAVKDRNRPIHLAEELLRKDANPGWASTILGAALYRAGRFAEAAQQLNKASTAWEQATVKPPVYSPAYIWFLLAMAHQRLGHAAEAQRWLDKAQKWMKEETQDSRTPAWNRRLTLQLLRREAEPPCREDAP